MIRVSVMLSFCCLAGVAATAQSSATKDPQAVQLVQAALNQDAGYAGATDFTASGTLVSTASSPTTATMVIKGRGLDQFKSVSLDSAGQSTVVASHGAGQYISESGAVNGMSYQAAEAAGMVILPFRRIALLLADPSTGLSNKGTISLNGQTLSDFRFSIPANNVLYGSTQIRNSPTSVDVYMDTSTGAIAAILDWTYSVGNSVTPLPHSYLFSNYQTVGTTQVPYSVVESIDNQPIWSVSLSAIQFNVGLGDVDFQF